MKIGVIVLSAAVMFGAESAAAADAMQGEESLTYEQFRERAASNRTEALLYLTGMASAFTVTNAMLRVSGKSPLYCQPGRMALSGPVLESIMDSYVANVRPDQATQPPDIVAIVALMDTFPC